MNRKGDGYRERTFENPGEAVKEFHLPSGPEVVGHAADLQAVVVDFDDMTVNVLHILGKKACLFVAMDRAALRSHIAALERSLAQLKPTKDLG